jgi:hypothetical protein
MPLMVLIVAIFWGLSPAWSQQQGGSISPVPYSVDQTHLTIWNGQEYVPFFIKGTNLGVAVPGTFPGNLAATGHQYAQWFREIKAAGFNTIRLYTLHYPRFYEILDSFNVANKQNPLLFFQGVWLNEELEGYENDLYFMTDTFKVEIEENIDCVHGNKQIAPRFGKAYGNFSADVSQWCLGYIIGREVHPTEVGTTNAQNPEINEFHGSHFTIEGASPTESWFSYMLDHLAGYEIKHYQTQRPVSVSNWPTLDPLSHPEELNEHEDSESLDFSKIQLVDAPAGFFISYHAYPYYPDFVSLQHAYQDFFDHYGSNSYLGYLTELKAHYKNIPLIIAEFGVPSSWANAHYATSGMNHGGFNEKNQGETNIRMLHNIKSAECGGGMQFAWIDEWFKRTWMTDPLDYNPQDRILWHNIASAEQNFGLKTFEAIPAFDTIAQFSSGAVTSLRADANYTFLELKIDLENPLDILDEIWVALDTYDVSLGESMLPSGASIPSRSEFLMHITNHSAKLFVTRAYDTYGIWHNISDPGQLFRSVATDGAPWKLIRYKNNYSQADVQYVGELKVNYDFQPADSKDAVIIHDDMVHIRLPWSYINFVAPNQMSVLHDDLNTPETEDRVSDGIQFSVKYGNQFYQSEERFVWQPWNRINDTTIVEKLKTSYFVMQERLPDFNTPALAIKDSFTFEGPLFPASVKAENGLLVNDYDLDGNFMASMLISTPANGNVSLNQDGKFRYQPAPAYVGVDSFEYSVFDGQILSQPVTVIINVLSNQGNSPPMLSEDESIIVAVPNPVQNRVLIHSKINFERLSIFNIQGVKMAEWPAEQFPVEIDLSAFPHGPYFILGIVDDKIFSTKIIKQ